jgi:hypothetical protein
LISGKTAFGHDFKALKQETEEKKNLERMFAGIIQPLPLIFGSWVTRFPTEYQRQLRKATLASEKVGRELKGTERLAMRLGGGTRKGRRHKADR